VIYTEGPFGLQKNKKIPFYIKNKRKIWQNLKMIIKINIILTW
jgi:hypothetical protein